MADSASRPEFDLINWIKNQSGKNPDLVLGIGDDAAILAKQPGKQWVTTLDVLTEGVHFTKQTDPKLIGRKSLAVNLSDLAAMAAQPIAAFIGLVLPKSVTRSYVESLYSGLFDLANEYGVSIAGGDTNSWDGPLVISVTLMGFVEPGQAMRRSGAKAGDWIFVTGALGGSLPSGRHLSFTPRVREAKEIVKSYQPTAMLDVSDGLASDLHHLATQSRVGIHIDGRRIPIHNDVDQSLEFESRLKHALNDGEDFELLFTVTPERGQLLEQDGVVNGLQVTRIGECFRKPGIKLVIDEQSHQLQTGGWSHHFGETWD